MTATELPGVKIIEPRVFGDPRGFFVETFQLERYRELAGIEFLAQNVKTTDFEDRVFKPYSLSSVNGVPLAVIGQSFPYTPIAHPRHLVPEWSFGIEERRLQGLVDVVRAKGEIGRAHV